MRYIGVLIRNLLAGPSTEAFPFGEAVTPKGLRGRVSYKAATCTACRSCEQVCSGGAIRFDRTPAGLGFTLWHDTCAFCGLCSFYCPTDAIQLTQDWHLVHTEDRKYDMVETGLIPAIKCVECGTAALATAPAADLFGHPPSPEELEWLRHYCPRCRRKKAAEGMPQ